jgi:hypothetical protein
VIASFLAAAHARAASRPSMKELLSKQKLEMVAAPIAVPVRLASVTVSETEGWNGNLDNRWHSGDAFRGTYAQEFYEGLSTYLRTRGYKLTTSKDAVVVRVTIDRFTGRRRSQQYGGDLKGTLTLRLNGKEIGRKTLLMSLNYQDESDECRAFAKDFTLEKVAFPTVLFYNLTVGFYDSIADGIQDYSPAAPPEPPPVVHAVVPPPPVPEIVAPPPPPTPEPPKAGIVTIDSQPDDAEVYLDSKLLATTPLRRLRLTAGDHTIMIKKAGYADWVRDITVLEDADVTLKATLEPNRPQAKPEEPKVEPAPAKPEEPDEPEIQDDDQPGVQEEELEDPEVEDPVV